MPAQDGTGPRGMGPQTGRGMGPCAFGRGRWIGYGRRWGRGYGRGWGRGFGPYFSFKNDISDEDQKEMLKKYKKDLEEELEAINKELS